MSKQEFNPLEVMGLILARWWVVLILTILGGLAGWIFHNFQPPIFEATASLTINLNFEKSELTQYESDTAFNAAGAIISSSNVMELFQEEALKNGLTLQDINRLHESRSVEAMESVWVLHARDRDPLVAAKYVNLWASISEQKLNDALKHALLAEQLQNLIDHFGNCLPSLTPIQETNLMPVECNVYSLDEINTYIQSWVDEMTNEKNLSQGVLPITSISLSSVAIVPKIPVRYNVGGLVLAGAILGFLVALWAASINKIHNRD